MAALDEYLRSSGLPSRSAAVKRAIRLHIHEQLDQDYAAAWQEWETSEEPVDWNVTTRDGLD